MNSQIFFHWSLIVLIVLGYFGAPSEALTSDTTTFPWVWVCRDSRCIKELADFVRRDTEEVYSLPVCKLLCNKNSVLWPIPRGSMNISRTFVSFSAEDLAFKNNAPSIEIADLMQEAIDIFVDRLVTMKPRTFRGYKCSSAIRHKVKVYVNITSDDPELKLGTDEKYELLITTQASSETLVYINSFSFYGARHALETLSQLIVWDEMIPALVMMKNAQIRDSPAFTHRGLAIDTARSYIPVTMIKKIIDGMSYDKLNVFHWHLTDTQSFPFVSNREPRMAMYGAYSSSKVYRPEDIRDIVHYATVRGVKVVPEFDAPAHVGSGWEWGPTYGLGHLVLCLNKQPWGDYCDEPPCGQLNPVNDNIYPILNNIYKDMSELFRSDIFHMGGDEVHMECWNETQEIRDWLKSKGRGNSEEDFIYLWSYFQNRSLSQLDEAYANQQPVILWTSSITKNGHAKQFLDPDRYILQIWDESIDFHILDIYRRGFKLILSNQDALYFDCGYGAWIGDKPNNWCSPYIGWQKVYENSPKKIITRFRVPYNEQQFLGGEAALWSEQVDSTGIENKLWPRGSAFAERMWSDPDTDWKTAEARLIHHRERLVERGIMADVIQPEWCYQNEGFCY